MKAIFIIVIFFFGIQSVAPGQNEGYKIKLTDLLNQKVIDFLRDNPNGDKILYISGSVYDVYPRKELSSLINKKEGIILVDYTFIYKESCKLVNNSFIDVWRSMNIMGEKLKFDKYLRKGIYYRTEEGEIPSIQVQKTPRKFIQDREFQIFLEKNKRTMPPYVPALEFYSMLVNLQQSRLANYSEKKHYYHEGEIYKVKQGDHYGLIDNSNNLLLPVEYTSEAALYDAYESMITSTDLKKFVTHYVETNLEAWNQKDEFESVEEYSRRTGKPNLMRMAIEQFATQACSTYQLLFSKNMITLFTLDNYDAKNQTFLVKTPLGDVPIFIESSKSLEFKHSWNDKKIRLRLPLFTYSESGISLDRVYLENNDDPKTILYGENTMSYQNYQVAQNASKIQIKIGQEDRNARQEAITPAEVDTRIPTTDAVAEKTFAVIIANEAYTREVKVPFALNDGEVFARYCRQTLGIPEKNIRVVKNATLNDMKFQLNWLSRVLVAYNGTAKAIVYYAGHGIPDEKQQSAYLLPADGYGSDASTGYALHDFYASLNDTPAQNITVFLDACFSGTKRENGMLASARGVAIKVRQEVPRGKMVVFSAAQGDETAYQYKEKGHGMFTYFLLKKLQETKGNATLGELGDYIISEVKKNSIVNNNKLQTPTVIPSAGMTETWKKETLK